MLFNSYEFLFLFLPVTVFGFAWIGKRSARGAIGLLAAASVLFYGWWDFRYLSVLGASISWNWLIGTALMRKKYRALLIAGVGVNLMALAYYKYYNFFVSTLNDVANSDLSTSSIVLPLGISFFTFTQIAFLVDAYNGKVNESGVVDYILFVTFFPHLMAGPVLHHGEMMPQFSNARCGQVPPEMKAQGLFLLVCGLVSDFKVPSLLWF